MATEIENLVINVESKGIDATSNAINSLTNTLNKIQVASNGASNGAKKTVTAFEKIKLAAQKATKPVKEFFSSFAGKMFSAVGVIALGKALSGAVNKANEYVESYNLFTVALGKYAGEAEAYAQQVSDAMGIDTAEWERAQGTIMTLVTGFGTLESRAYTMSKNLTQLGYDLSSFFNISVGDAMTKIESGIAGELEPLRRLGYDLSQTKLQAVALQLGIKKSVAEMTQAEKAELRYYAIMTQVTTAQGDMARTLDSPANQIRILKAQFEMLTRTIGTIFIPILNKVLPYLIAVAKALRGIAEEIASMAGFSLADVTYDTGGLSDFNDDLQETTESANELKKSLMGFDEINKLSDKTDGVLGTGTGFSFDLPEYDFLGDAVEKKSDEIFNRVKKKLDELRNKITSFINNIKNRMPKDAFSNLVKSLDKVKKALKDFSESPAWQTIKDFLAEITAFSLDVLINFFSDLADSLASTLEFLSDPTWENYKQMVSDVCDLLTSIPDSIYTYLTMKIEDSDLPDWAKNILKGALKAFDVVISILFPTVGIPKYIKALIEGDFVKTITVGIITIGAVAAGVIAIVGGSLGVIVAIGVLGWTLIAAAAVACILLIIKNWDKITAKFKETKEKISNWWEDLKKSFMNMNWIDTIITNITNAIGNLFSWFKGLKIGGKKVDVEVPNIEAKANGGYVNSGQLFIAREAGAEMVGSMNGHTAVANNDQITDGIYRAVLQAMRESGGGNGNNGSTTFVAQLNGKTLFEEVVRQNRTASNMYGKSPLSI